MSSITFGSIFLFIKVASIRPLTVEATHTKTKLDLTKLFYWGSFTTPICSMQR